jgi:hypothetical protein
LNFYGTSVIEFFPHISKKNCEEVGLPFSLHCTKKIIHKERRALV